MLLRSWLAALRRPTAGPAIDWRRHHRSGLRDYSAETEERTRYWVLTGYCAGRFANPDVLDVGCGTGILEEKLRRIPYRTYTGLDIAPDAIDQARASLPASCRLICADMMEFTPADEYDAILFNESIIPGMRAAAIVERYGRHLRAGGRILISMFDGRNRRATLPLWKELGDRFTIEDSVRVDSLSTGKSWTIALLDPTRR